MGPDMIVSLMMKTLQTALMIAAPLLVAGLVIGLMVSIFQAVTQIQEMTLTFIPKILAVSAALLFFFPWMMQTIVSYTVGLFQNIHMYIGK